jgi:23S rRNA (pseudouridine1915-N3)-methyltransferase
MKTLLIVVGKTTNKALQTLLADYQARIAHHMHFTVEVQPELKNTRALTHGQQKQHEARQLLTRLHPGDHIVLLDPGGVQLTSTQLAQWLAQRQAAAPRRLVFIIGGPYGFHNTIYQAAAEKIALSKLTFSHQTVRLIFLEQLYRACTIIRGLPYHHE